MRTKIWSLATLFILMAVSVFAGNKTEKIVVKGNCEMCESRIEKAVKGIDGVSKADWDKTTKKLEVTFDDAKTSVNKIEVAVAKVGHDTAHQKASDNVYNKLPDCCKYERAEQKKDNHAGHQH